MKNTEMRPSDILNEVAMLPFVAGQNTHFYCTEEGIFHCSVNLHCFSAKEESQAFRVLRELPQPDETYTRSYGGTSHFTCVSMRWGNFIEGGCDVNLFIQDVQ